MRRFPYLCLTLFAVLALAAEPLSVPVLCYHRFGATAVDSMTVRTSNFASHLQYLKAHGYHVIPLRLLVEHLQRGAALPDKPVVITADDGHRTVYEEMWPLIKQYQVPVTLFIYPSAISNAKYAMTWEQLSALQQSGLFDVQAHTFWHPNFKQEKKRLTPEAYAQFVQMQLQKSKLVLEKHMGKPMEMLAWPFGIYDDELLQAAKAAGYVAAFSIDGRSVAEGDRMLALPRFLMVDAIDVKRFANLLNERRSNAVPAVH